MTKEVSLQSFLQRVDFTSGISRRPTSVDLDIEILSLVCHFFLGIYSGFIELSM